MHLCILQMLQEFTGHQLDVFLWDFFFFLFKMDDTSNGNELLFNGCCNKNITFHISLVYYYMNSKPQTGFAHLVINSVETVLAHNAQTFWLGLILILFKAETFWSNLEFMTLYDHDIFLGLEHSLHIFKAIGFSYQKQHNMLLSSFWHSKDDGLVAIQLSGWIELHDGFTL